jgi:hypothetical protein
MASLHKIGARWKGYERSGEWVYEQHPFWCTGFTFWDLANEAPDLFLHLSKSDLVIFKGDLNHRKLTYDCAAPPSTSFEDAIGPLASLPGAPRIVSLRTIKSDVVVGLPSDEIADKLDKTEPGWKISGKYVCRILHGRANTHQRGLFFFFSRLSFSFLKVDLARKFASPEHYHIIRLNGTSNFHTVSK